MKIYKHVTANSLYLEPFEFQRELSMESYLVENERVLGLDDELFQDASVICEELPIVDGRKCKATDGRIDLLIEYPEAEMIGLLELKKGEISERNIEQLHDYLLQRDKILKSDLLKDRFMEIKDYKWLGILAGTSIDSELVTKIYNGLELDVGGVKIPVAALTIKRFKSEDGQVFIITDTYINSAKSVKDLRQYFFNNHNYGKARLVHAVIKEYVNKNQELTFNELKNKFPDSIRSSWGIFVKKADAISVNNRGYKRYFTKDEELITLKDGDIAVTNQWGLKNIDKFIEVANKLGMKIK